MSDARLDLEVVINGTQYVAKGLDDIADASKRVGKAASVTTGETRVLTSAIAGLSRGAVAAQAGSNALAQLIAGNFVGAFRSATTAVKMLWAAMWSNPITALVAGVAALAGGLFLLMQRHANAADAAQEQAKAERELLAEIEKMKGTDPLSVKKASADSAAQRGDLDYLKKMVASYRELVAERESFTKWTGGLGMDALQEAVDALNVYEEAIRNVEQATKDSAVSTENETRTIEDQIAKEKELAAAKEARAAADLSGFREDVGRAKQLEQAKDDLSRAELERKFILEDFAKIAPGGGSAGDLAWEKNAEALRKKELEIAEIKTKAAEATAAEGRRRLLDAAELRAQEAAVAAQKAGVNLEAAKQNVLNPGDAEREAREQEKAKRKEELRLQARLSGNSKEAVARRAAFERAQWDEWWAADQAALAQNKLDLMKAETADPSLAKLDAIKGSVDALRGDLTGGA